mmetsp:Transcript_38241/g.91940  ORF Transcript_38241/g.91940 Transcript_38241/m.91940 type:complete len:249 (-) Transcript_38241:105-851(-)
MRVACLFLAGVDAAMMLAPPHPAKKPAPWHLPGKKAPELSEHSENAAHVCGNANNACLRLVHAACTCHRACYEDGIVDVRAKEAELAALKANKSPKGFIERKKRAAEMVAEIKDVKAPWLACWADCYPNPSCESMCSALDAKCVEDCRNGYAGTFRTLADMLGGEDCAGPEEPTATAAAPASAPTTAPAEPTPAAPTTEAPPPPETTTASFYSSGGGEPFPPGEGPPPGESFPPGEGPPQGGLTPTKR